MALDKKVEKKVARLLALVVDSEVDQESYDFVLRKLTRMAVLGAAPAGTGTKPASVKHEQNNIKDDHSTSKENWIAR